tara:strand:- start:978 stop:2837 length:1860 start_codon:yes stop_codon:yes gene_type:complete
MAEETVIIRFQGDASSVESAANAASNAVEGVEKTTKTAGKGFDVLGTIATGAFQAIGAAAVNLASAGFAKITDFIAGSIEEASSFQSVFAQTEAVVKSTGEAAGLTADQMADMADALSAASGMSLFSDDAILGAQNVLATFTQIRGENFGGATQAIIDMSQALGTDLQSSAMQVGKALNDPLAGITALGRAGVQFTDDQKAMIKSMVEAGDVAGAQSIILGELTTQFGGSALAAVDTFAGRQVVLQEKLANVQQTLGNALLPIIERFAGFASTTLIPVVEAMVIAFTGFADDTDWDGIIASLNSTASALGNFINGTDWQGGLDSIGAGFASFEVYVDPVTLALQNLAMVAVPVFTSIYNSIMATLGNPAIQANLAGTVEIFTLLGQILFQVVGIAIDSIRNSLQSLFTVFNIVWPYISMAFTTWIALMQPLQTLVVGALTAISQLLRNDTAGAFDTVKNAVSTFVTTVNTAVQGMVASVATAISAMVKSLVTAAVSLGSQIASGIAQGISNGAAAIANAAKNAASSALDAAKKLLGIASPSKVFADQVGYQMSAGMAAGIARGIPDVTSAIGAVSGAGVGAVNQSTQNYYLSASYQTAQSESSIGQDLRAMQLLAGGMA